MNKRMFGMFPVPETYSPILLAQQPFQRAKKSPVKTRAVGCSRCGVRQVTLRKNGNGQLLCPKCYEGRGKR